MDIWHNPDKRFIYPLAIVMGLLFIGFASLLLPEGSKLAVIAFDRESTLIDYPFTIQNFMHLVFFFGLAELYLRWRTAEREREFLSHGYLPEDDSTILQAQDLGDIRKSVSGRFDGDNGFLPSLIDICVLQFFSTRAIDQVVSVLNSSLELIAHRVDLRYSVIRYIVWVIPTVGFIGTVVGIAITLDRVNPDNPDLKLLTTSLAVAFNTTLVALVLSAILVFLLHIVQKREEESLNLAGHYCLKNLVNRLYAGDR